MPITVKRGGTVTSGALADRPSGKQGLAHIVTHSTDRRRIFVHDGNNWVEATVPTIGGGAFSGGVGDVVRMDGEFFSTAVTSAFPRYVGGGLEFQDPDTVGNFGNLSVQIGGDSTDVQDTETKFMFNNTKPCLLVVSNEGDRPALYLIGKGPDVITEVSDPDNSFTNTQDNANTVNIFFENGSLKIQNNTGATVKIGWLALITDGT